MLRIFNQKEFNTYKDLCCLKTSGVMKTMANFLKQKYNQVIVSPAYLIAVGDIPIGLCAHADTVFDAPPNRNTFFYDKEKNVIWSPDGAGADDRAGVFSILYILKNTNLRPYIFITTGEETFCQGANKLCANYAEFPYKLKYLIQLDRRGRNDAVYYDCANPDFEKYINKFGFQTAMGSFTDISVLAPHFKCAAVNLSIGYIHEHTRIEHLFVSYLFDTIEKVIKLLHDENNAEYFAYIEKVFYTFDKAQDKVLCDECSKMSSIEEVLPLYSIQKAKNINLCLDCYAKMYNKILWCDTCYQGYLFPYEVNTTNKYICHNCMMQTDN